MEGAMIRYMRAIERINNDSGAIRGIFGGDLAGPVVADPEIASQ